MRDHHQRRSEFLVEFLDQLHYVLARLPIQVPRRLIREQNPWLVREGPRKCHPLLLTTRELSRIVAPTVPQTHPLQECGRSRANRRSILVRSAASNLQGHHHIFESGKRRQEMKGLEYEPYVVCSKPRPPVFGKSLEIFTGYGYRAFGRLVESGEEAQQCRLSATRRANDRHEALRLHVEIHPVQHTKGLTPTHV